MTNSADLSYLKSTDLSWFYFNLCPDEISKIQALIKHPRSIERRNSSWRPPSYHLGLPYDDGWATCDFTVRKTKLSTSFTKHAKRYFPNYARLGSRNLYLVSAEVQFHSANSAIAAEANARNQEELAERALGLVATALGPLESPHILANPYSSHGTTIVVNWFCDSTGSAYPDYSNALMRVQQAYHAVA